MLIRGRIRSHVLIGLLLCGAILFVAGCSGGEPDSEVVASCGGEGCHAEMIEAQLAGPHAELACDACHDGTGAEHAADPATVIATTDWRVEACRPCHGVQVATYLYDDNAQPGPFGGSQRVPPQPKTDALPQYNDVIAGHGFTKEYNEEGAHLYLLQDHRETTRTKYETCMQCKSTKVALAWRDAKTLHVAKDTEVELTHTATPTSPAKSITIPAGTTLQVSTDPGSFEVSATAVFPDGTAFHSPPGPSEDATASFNTLWATTVAVTEETMPYGAGCNHCHDPHTTKDRIVRSAMVRAFENGGVDGQGGLNPYDPSRGKDFSEASSTDSRTLLCGQCHVEYTCGKSGVDGKDRDAFGWSKAGDLHELYLRRYDYKQDWKHKVIGEPLIKSQHPELELYWESIHYDAGVACDDCHMPDVKVGGKTYTSHWFTSPYKYEDERLFAKFALATGVSMFRDQPCDRCHENRKDTAIEQQKTVYERQKVVQAKLVTSAAALGAAKKAGTVDAVAYDAALESHRKAHVLWENLIVSENSMGFHNYAEVMDALDTAEQELDSAIGAMKAYAPK